MADPSPIPTLDLATLVEPRIIGIDGTPYPFRRRDMLTLKQHLTLEGLSVRVADVYRRLKAGEDVTADEEAECSALLAAMVAIAIEAPAEVLAKMTDVQRLQVCDLFLPMPSRKLAPTADPTPASPSAGANSSPA